MDDVIIRINRNSEFHSLSSKVGVKRVDSWPSGLGSQSPYCSDVVAAGALLELSCSRRASGYFTLIGDEARRTSRLVNFVLLTPETSGLVGIW